MGNERVIGYKTVCGRIQPTCCSLYSFIFSISMYVISIYSLSMGVSIILSKDILSKGDLSYLTYMAVLAGFFLGAKKLGAKNFRAAIFFGGAKKWRGDFLI